VAFDTKYRPTRFEDVLGQPATVQILREIIKAGAGYRQSYLFCGPFGSGKTTLGRILARGLLCDSPVNGAPCDRCPSCLNILQTGSSVDFVEVDAATNSGKDNIRRIIEQIAYSSFSGKRRIYLFDEAHQLSRDALDALLKPMEDNVPGTQDKRLICIFCTTEPEKMRATVVSRCAPAFLIRHADPTAITNRLREVCEAEGVTYEDKALALVAEYSEAHIRDALKTIEGVSLLGGVTMSNVTAYLQLETSSAIMALLDAIVNRDSAGASELGRRLLEVQSPAVLYERVAHTAITLYSHGLSGSPVPSWWNPDRVCTASAHGTALAQVADRFASRPGRVNSSVFLCDIAIACNPPVPIQTVEVGQIPPASSTDRGDSHGRVYNPVSFQSSPAIIGGAYLDPRGVNKAKVEDGISSEHSHGSRPPGRLSANAFSDHVVQRLLELNDGSKGQEDVGDPGANQDR